MQDFLSGEAVSIRFTYGSGHEPVIPDVGSVTYTLLSAAGTPVAGVENIPITTDSATFSSRIDVPSLYNVIPMTKTFDRRSIIIRFAVNGVTDWQRINYRLIPSLPYTVTAATVRAFLGVNKTELPDEDIDLFSAYVYVQEAVSDPSLLTAALSSGDKLELLANDVIAMRAAIDIIPSLQNRVTQAEKNGVMGFDRIKIKDFSALLADAYSRYYAGLELVGMVDETAGIPVTLLITTTDTDPVTAGT